MKYLIWALLIYFVWRWYISSTKKDRGQDASGGQAARGASGAETMVQCAQCGVHLPVSEALPGANGAVFCSQEHRSVHASTGR